MSSAPPAGYIKLARKQFDGLDLFWGDGTKYDSRSAWTDIIQLAAWKPYTYRGVDPLERGEFVASVRFLAERWKWPKSTVLDWLKRCEKAGRIIGQRTGHHGRVYLLVNYDTYQAMPDDGRTPDRTAARTKAGHDPDSGRTNKNAVNTRTTTPLSADADVSAVLTHYVSRHPNRRPGTKDAKTVQRALGLGYSVAELCDAIDGNATDAWHVEKRKHELAYVLRDNGKIDDFRAKVSGPAASSASASRPALWLSVCREFDLFSYSGNQEQYRAKVEAAKQSGRLGETFDAELRLVRPWERLGDVAEPFVEREIANRLGRAA